MTMGLGTTLRNTRLLALKTALDAGTTGALIRVYDGAKPTNPGDAVTTQVLLGTLTMSTISFPDPTTGSMVAYAITQDTAADASGTATWARMVDSTGAFVADIDVGTAAPAELVLNSVNIVQNGTISVTSCTFTEGNATNS